MTIETNQVYSFKLTSGEEVVAKVIGTTDTEVSLSEPLSLAPGPKGMGFIGSLFTSEENEPVTLNINAVTMYTKTATAIKDKYTETVTGISVPPTKKIILG